MMFSADVIRSRFNRITAIIRVEMHVADKVIHVTVRGFSTEAIGEPNAIINGARMYSTGAPMRGTINPRTKMVDGIEMLSIADDVRNAIVDGIQHMTKEVK